MAEIVDQYGDQLAGRIVVEITNPIDFETLEGLVVSADTSAAEQLAERLPDATVVKAFNTTFARTLVVGEVDGHPLDVLIAGDEEEAKLRVAALAEAGGLRAIDVGPLRRARQLEQLGFLHVLVQEPLGTGYASAVKFLA